MEDYPMSDEKIFDIVQRLSRIEQKMEDLPAFIKQAVSELPQKGIWKPADVIKVVTLVLGSGGLGAGILQVISMLANG